MAHGETSTRQLRLAGQPSQPRTRGEASEESPKKKKKKAIHLPQDQPRRLAPTFPRLERHSVLTVRPVTRARPSKHRVAIGYGLSLLLGYYLAKGCQPEFKGVGGRMLSRVLANLGTPRIQRGLRKTRGDVSISSSRP